VGEAIDDGHRAIVLTLPTGGGKTRLAGACIKDWLSWQWKVGLYTNRRIMLEQLSDDLKEMDLTHGIRAAGYDNDFDLPLQLSSMPTETSRSKRAKKLQGEWLLHDAQAVVIDEAHLQAGPQARRIIQHHLDQGAVVLGLTATPCGLAEVYKHLVVAGTMSDLRRCGAVVWADHYGPDEPDLRYIRGVVHGKDLSEQQNRKAIMNATIWGRVWDWYRDLNPDGRPTLLFAPGVQESLWFAEQFSRKGVRAAHIDGEDCWDQGHYYKSSRGARRDLLQGSENGDIEIICNRFVLREGVDAPWIEHGVIACVLGSLPTYLQTLGRLVRASRGKRRCTIQDHGGNWWRHGSINEDRTWHLEDTETILYHRRADQVRSCAPGQPGAEPYRCPECGLITIAGRCRGCGWMPQGRLRSRPVITIDGELEELTGKIFNPRRLSRSKKGKDDWERIYWASNKPRGQKGSRTFRAAAAWFATKHNWHWPDPSWPLMPKGGPSSRDWDRLIFNVPFQDLIPKEAVHVPTE
jgi:superfamily II DNA or RNA helicase